MLLLHECHSECLIRPKCALCESMHHTCFHCTLLQKYLALGTSHGNGPKPLGCFPYSFGGCGVLPCPFKLQRLHLKKAVPLTLCSCDRQLLQWGTACNQDGAKTVSCRFTLVGKPYTTSTMSQGLPLHCQGADQFG